MLSKNITLKHKAVIALITLTSLFVSGCGNQQEVIDPLYLNTKAEKIEVQEELVDDDVEVDEETAKTKELIKQMTMDYAYRVYNINQDTPLKDYPDYIDENTTKEDWYKRIRGCGMRCEIIDCVQSGVDVDPITEEATGIVVITAHYSDVVTDEGDYYIPLCVYFRKIDDEWKILDSMCSFIASVNDYDLYKDELSGFYVIEPKENTKKEG